MAEMKYVCIKGFKVPLITPTDKSEYEVREGYEVEIEEETRAHIRLRGKDGIKLVLQSWFFRHCFERERAINDRPCGEIRRERGSG